MKTLILTEDQIRNVIDNLINEQNENKKESLVVNFGAVWPVGKWKLTPQQIGGVNQKLVQITDFINKHSGSKVTIQIEAGESRITNSDNEVTPSVKLTPGELSKKRGNEMVNFLNQYFKSLVGKTISQNEIPNIPEPKTIIGQTPYGGPKDLQDKSKMALYNQEQFVRAVITTEKNYDCIVGLEITIAYKRGESSTEHICDEAIFQLKMNGVPLGEVNLNNGALDTRENAKIRALKVKNSSYNKRLERANKLFDTYVKNGDVKEFGRAQFIKDNVGEKPEQPGLPEEFTMMAQKNGYSDVQKYADDIKTITDSFNSYGRTTDGAIGGSRSQTFILDGAKAKSIIDNAPSDKIVLSIVPLVSQNGKYKLFHNKGSHADTPFVTIKNPKLENPILYNQEPNVGMKRGSVTETVLLTTDLCGNPSKKV